jgi:hypothetical protein
MPFMAATSSNGEHFDDNFHQRGAFFGVAT